MNPQRTYLILTALFTLIFILLVLLGSYLLSIHSKQFAIAAFLFSFGAVFAQIASLALYLRQKARIQAARTPSEGKPHV